MAEEEVTKTAIEAPVSADEAAEAKTKAKPKRRKLKRNVSHGKVHILATFNNTIVTVSDDKGNVIASASAGSSGFRGSKKGTAYAAQVATEKALTEAKNFGLSKVEVIVKGIGLGRDAAIRSLVNQKLAVENIRDKTGTPHGGTRPRKPKRN